MDWPLVYVPNESRCGADRENFITILQRLISLVKQECFAILYYNWRSLSSMVLRNCFYWKIADFLALGAFTL